MPIHNKSNAYTHAEILIKAALEGGAIKLVGAVGGTDAKKCGDTDAQYLKALLDGLANALMTDSERRA